MYEVAGIQQRPTRTTTAIYTRNSGASKYQLRSQQLAVAAAAAVFKRVSPSYVSDERRGVGGECSCLAWP